MQHNYRYGQLVCSDVTLVKRSIVTHYTKNNSDVDQQSNSEKPHKNQCINNKLHIKYLYRFPILFI